MSEIDQLSRRIPRNRLLITKLAITASLFSFTAILVRAQSDKATDSPGIEAVATGIKGISAFRPLPRGFNAEGESDESLRVHGLPPRPDKQRSPRQFEIWKKLVESSSYRIIPRLKTFNIYHGPVKGWAVNRAPSGNPTPAQSSNWSGFVINDASNIFKQGVWLSASYTVPGASDCLPIIPNERTWSSNWIGIDGSGSNDVLQIGTSSDAACNETFYGPHALYYAWIEWYPAAAAIISNFGIIPGDSMDLEIILGQSPGQFTVYLDNRTRRLSVTFQMNPPSNTQLVGNSLEWIVERPTVNGVLTHLAPYTRSGWRSMDALLSNGNTYLPSSAPTGTSYAVTMFDENGKSLSVPTLYPSASYMDSAWFIYSGSH